MDKIKDFIYDKNDIVIALLILVVAALIIFWRLDIILEYPKTLVTGDDTIVTEPVGGDENLPPADNDEDTDQSGEGTQTDDDQTQSGDVEGTDTPVEIPLWDGGMLTEEVEVEVEGNSSESAVGCLIDKGLFKDYAEYMKVCEDAGLDHEKVAAGTFTFKEGTTKAQIAKKINWG